MYQLSVLRCSQVYRQLLQCKFIDSVQFEPYVLVEQLL